MADDTDDSGGVILEGPFDPDAQATVTDFIDYTEYLPSDLIRSLTLIRGLDETYLDATQTVHELTKVYGKLPDLPPESRPNPQELREKISIQLNRAINAREASYAEACRLYDVVDPPSREPTPIATLSPAAKRSRSGRKTEEGTTRITLRVDGQGSNKAGLPKSRNRRSAIVGLDPDSPIASTEQSDNETPKAARSRRGHAISRGGEGPSPKKDKKRSRPARPPGKGSNGRSVAGISTSGALALLNPPPEDAKIGSEDLPWLRLTEWEMTKLRKKMKKNAIWQPSEIMINRELARNERGWECYRAAKARAEATGEEFIDCDDIENTYVPGKLTRKTEATADTSAAEEIKTSNRGMKLNEAKRLKRETLARENAAAWAAAEAEMAAKRLRDVGSSFKSLFATSPEANYSVPGLINSPIPNGMPSTPSSKAKNPKKRKAEQTPSTEPVPVASSVQPSNDTVSPKPSSKRRKLSKASPIEAVTEATVPSTAATSTVAEPGAPIVDSISPSETTKTAALKVTSSSPPPTRARSAASRASVAPTIVSISSGVAKKVTTPTPPTTRPPSRRRSADASTLANSMILLRDPRRRKSATPAAKTPGSENRRGSSTGPSVIRRKKRPAPGPVSANLDGGATVSHGKRKFKPKKRAGGKDSVKGDDYRIDEDGVLEKVDPNEPRYCLCKDVSFGIMINCENSDCEGEWFHLECVGLKEPPSRRATWYCPDCRVKLNKAPDGIEKVGTRR
ncbi:hypothetical protein BGW36DRAFT_385076 [Talaromyces proteolyticus]|uniref:PHD-type domain-containing protein n=1 Tax=Talaromyces proteolyticus TaxID=1131652 RepID=A0AAD4PT62_9EURO|nr:uncharacterized protein BGW36DRAFT_385076 [Talaromyces proteolyticus]KAH8692730.1 hypothetical protein BGW36DRAFT_385076 [Talaromyces proteolyticus]